MKVKLATAGSGRKVHKGIDLAACCPSRLNYALNINKVDEAVLCERCFPGGIEQARAIWEANNG